MLLNNRIFDTLTDDITEANKELGSMVGILSENEKQIVNQEIEEEFSRSLSGFTVDKSKYVHVNQLDPKELFDLTSNIKKKLDLQKDFYLHGDYNFYN